MDILRLKGKNDDGYTTEILSAGMKQIKLSESDWPAEAEQKQRAEAIYQKISPYLRKVE